MNSKLFLMAVAVVAAFGIVVAAVGSPLTIATPAVALLAGRDNATVMAGNMTAGGNMTRRQLDQIKEKFLILIFLLTKTIIFFSTTRIIAVIGDRSM